MQFTKCSYMHLVASISMEMKLVYCLIKRAHVSLRVAPGARDNDTFLVSALVLVDGVDFNQAAATSCKAASLPTASRLVT